MTNLQKNPFDPSFGTPPNIMLPNYQSDFESPQAVAEAINYGDPNRVIFITGLRGSGKTALLTKIEQQVKELKDTYILEIDNNQHMVQTFAQGLKNIFRFYSLLDHISAISIMGFELSFSKNNEGYTTQDIENFMVMLTKLNKKVVIFIDEFNHKENTREFIRLLQNLKRHNLNFYLVADGLPQMIYEIEHDQTLNFLKRARHIQTTMLNVNLIENEYQKYLKFSPLLTHQMAQLTGGYSFGFQLLGYKFWNAINISQQLPNQQTFEMVKQLYIQDLFTQSYDIIFDNLSENDRKYLIGTANNLSTSQIALLMNYDRTAKQQQNYVNQYRRRMIQQDLIIRLVMVVFDSNCHYLRNI
ncbi:ATP-binding protein [Limosilactobacillus rudii]|uniref:ATP-binding protein n=1 Tax=Limosilactobacillus rudii TaxID=2759755 RepID=UPI001E4E98CB|nr:ATP-binding protein [Limosilactobacillus rudii]MCD7134600.1 ATP-binding protein [Limosilactobacillus rudii]